MGSVGFAEDESVSVVYSKRNLAAGKRSCNLQVLFEILRSMYCFLHKCQCRKVLFVKYLFQIPVRFFFGKSHYCDKVMQKTLKTNEKIGEISHVCSHIFMMDDLQSYGKNKH